MSPTILVTGGAGFIGSHTCVALTEAGYTPLILDNLGNSDARVIDRLAAITGSAPRLVEGDVRDRALVDRLFQHERIAAVIHFAGLKAVGDSVADPYMNAPYASLSIRDDAKVKIAPVHSDFECSFWLRSLMGSAG